MTTTQNLRPGCNVVLCPLLQMDWTFSHWTGDACPNKCRSCTPEKVKAELDRETGAAKLKLSGRVSLTS